MIKGSPPILDQFVFKVRETSQLAKIQAKMQASKQAKHSNPNRDQEIPKHKEHKIFRHKQTHQAPSRN